MKRIFFMALAMAFLYPMLAQSPVNHTYPLTNGPDKNPMKGWNSGWWDSFEESTVGFQYLKWKDFEPSDGAFDFNAVESVINRPGSQGRHLILRLYADWFGNDQQSDACPDWIYATYGVERLQAPNGKYITNYNHPNYITQVIEAIEALADHYKDDPRMYAVELGVLGYWGEWHTFSFNDPNFEIEETTMNEILDSYKTNYSRVQLMGRYPWREPLASDDGIGYHNDFFVPNNGHSNEFDEAIELNEKWKHGPIGGENPPINEADREQYMTDLYETPAGMNMITTGHYSTMKLGSTVRADCENDPNGSRCQGFMALHRKMGYNFQITNALFPESLESTDHLTLELDIENIGVAPIYFDWEIQIALLDNSNEPVLTSTVPFDLRTIQPDQSTYTISNSIPLSSIAQGNYQLAVRVIQPGADDNKSSPWELEARNTYILFSNELPSIQGNWNANNALTGGWSLLGNVEVSATTAAMHKVLIYHDTNGFRHGSINDGINLITNLGTSNGLWTTDETRDSAIFSSTELNDYDLVIWCNTSGNGLLTAAEQAGFEAWVGNGGAFMGIHAATDTYRNGSWPFYNELVGAIVQTGPNHTSNNFNATMDVLEKHSSADHVSPEWNKNEEYYYWERNGGQLSTDNNNVLFVRSTGSNSYDAPRPIAWYKTSITVGGVTTPVRAFYTALGHNGNDYNSNTEFQEHIEGAILWALPPAVTTFSGGSWDNGTPTVNMRAVVNSAYNTASNGIIEARDLVVNTGATLTVEANTHIEIRENITVDGTLIVEHQGNVVQTSNAGVVTKNGTINVNLTTPVLEGRDYTILGSPMSTETQNVFTGAWRVLEFNSLNFIPHPEVPAGGTNWADDDGDFYNPHTGVINPGEGYLVRPTTPNNSNSASYDYTFANGSLNNGRIIYLADNIGTANGTPQVIANPYASAISADAFFAANPDLTNAYFWEHLTQPSAALPGPGGRDFDMDDISIYNGVTGMGLPAANDPGNTMGTAPNGVIASGQGFGVRTPGASGTTDIVFTNAMRLTSGNTTLRTNSDSQQIVLELRSKEYGIGSFTGIAFTEFGTSGYDPVMETTRLATTVSLFSQTEGSKEQLGIQAMGNFDESTVILLGIHSQVEATMEFQISIADVQGTELQNAAIYLLDTVTGIETNLVQRNHIFETSNGMFEGRFQLRFEKNLGVHDTSAASISLYPNPTNGALNIVSPNSSITQVVIHDIGGRMVAKELFDRKEKAILDLSKFQQAMYFVTVTTIAGSNTKQLIKR